MSIKTRKPTTPSQRHTVLLSSKGLSKKKGTKRLMIGLKSKAGRNSSGKITMRHRGGGVKRSYRIIDFKRDKFDIPAVVESLEYDPNRTASLALLKYADGERRYIVAPEGLNVGDSVISSQKEVSVKPGNSTTLKNIPYGTNVNSVELKPGGGAQVGRSAGNSLQIMGGDKQYIQLKMPSGEIRLVREECMATVGVVSNADMANVQLGKAGRRRRMGFRPSVRGVAMSGGQHPHGDGQGKSGRHGPGGPSKDKWGNKYGVKTRKNKRTNKYIVRRVETKTRKTKQFKTII